MKFCLVILGVTLLPLVYCEDPIDQMSLDILDAADASTDASADETIAETTAAAESTEAETTAEAGETTAETGETTAETGETTAETGETTAEETTPQVTEEVTSSGIGISLSPNAQIPETTPETNKICPGSIGMTDEIRLAYLDLHNTRRSMVALGTAVKNDGTYMPGAKNMLKLIYDCELELSALQYAGQCPKIGSDPSSRGEQGENFYQLTESGEDFLKAAKKSSRQWYSVVTVYPGIGKAAKYRANHVGTPIVTFTQMVWAKTRRMGCSIVHCPPLFTAVCRYTPAGNVVGETVYDPGEACVACPSTCNDAMGLCNMQVGE